MLEPRVVQQDVPAGQFQLAAVVDAVELALVDNRVPLLFQFLDHLLAPLAAGQVQAGVAVDEVDADHLSAH